MTNNSLTIKSLIEIGSKCRIIMSAEGKLYAALGKYAIDVDSEGFTQFLVRAYLKENYEAPLKSWIDQALYSLKNAYWNPERQDIWIRYARSETGIKIDIDHETDVLEISTSGVRQIREDSGLFIKKRHLEPLYAVAENPDFDLLWRYINVQEEDQPLITEFLISCIGAKPPYPILHVSGPAGSGKTTLTRVIKAIIDPDRNPLRSAPKTVEDLKVAAHNTLLLALDNTGRITRDFSDALCVIATGGTIAGRRLYTNNEEVAVDISRPVIINGLYARVEFEDLAQRCRFIELKEISGHKLSTSLENSFKEDLPRIRMALYQSIVCSLASEKNESFEGITRMADVEAFAEPAMESLGISVSRYYEALTRVKERSLGDESERFVVDLVCSLLDKHGTFEGNASLLSKQLMDELEDSDDSVTVVTANILTILAPLYISSFLLNSKYRRYKNIEIEKKRTGRGRVLKITKRSQN